MPIPPAVVSVGGFKVQFDRAFKYGSGADVIRDSDITAALVNAASLFNEVLWDTQSLPVAYYFLSAHLLVLNVQAAGGLSGVNFGLGADNRNSGQITTKSVGSVSVTYGISQKLIDDPVLSQFMETSFGRRYLQMVSPRIVGHAISVSGPRDPGAAIPNIPFMGP